MSSESHMKNSVLCLGTLCLNTQKMKEKKKHCHFPQLSERDALSKMSESRTPCWFYIIKQEIKCITLFELFQDCIKAKEKSKN